MQTNIQALHPPLKWSQRSDKVFIKIEMRDIKDEVINFSDGTHLKISCVSGDKHYEETFELFEPIKAEESSFKKTGFNICIILIKAEEKSWTRIHKTSAKYPNIGVDWNNWVDSDEEDEEVKDADFDFGQGGMGGGMGGMGGGMGGGFPGMGGMGGGFPGMGGMGGMGGGMDQDKLAEMMKQMQGGGFGGGFGGEGDSDDEEGNLGDLEGEADVENTQAKGDEESEETQATKAE